MSLTLITGGARSGKSLHAESLALLSGGQPCYIFTAEIHDAEMADRVAVHKARRGRVWQEHHAPHDLVAALAACTGSGTRLVDCLTLWVSNLMMIEADLEAETDALISALRVTSQPVVLVTSEVGFGIVPDNALARRFRDALGLLNQRIGNIADRVDLVVAGQVLRIK